MGVIAGIKEEELSDLTVEILNYADKINNVLNQFDDKFYELESVYEGEAYNHLKDYYNTYVRDKFNVVKNNVISYSDDLIALIRKMNEGSDSLVRLFNQFEDANKAEIKKLNN